ncbi:PAS domain S-box protein [Hymenobacter lutimineralis]|uniref:histidine kinase n=1 Tax=Hymenobacter lutimineralis TaxID=2606448 RepID=A0A5D6V6M2_9BACT|nr:PAS domain S-box protein [Hymenobacter lutimineralis]TYZ10907.1 PAS domain S-box protein [Hymenobacter lutimineralis]
MLPSDRIPAHVFFEQHPDAVFTLNAAGEIVRANGPFAELLGCPAAQVAGRSFWACLQPGERERAGQGFEQALAGETCVLDLALGGAVSRRMTCTLFPLLINEQVQGVQGILQDVGPPNYTEKGREPEHMLSVIFNTIADVVFVLEVGEAGSFRFSFANRAFTQTTGIPLEQILGKRIEEVIPEPSLSMYQEKYRLAVATQQRLGWLDTTVFPAGRVTGQVSITPVVEADGSCRQLVGIVHDQTSVLQAAEALTVSNERYKYAIRATTDAIYDWNIPENTLFWGEGFEALFGHMLVQNVSNLDLWAEFIHPDDSQQTVYSLMQAVEAPHVRYWQGEYRFRRADNTWATVFDRGYVLRDAAGQPLRMIGAMQDISERKEAEERQRRMAQEVFKQNADLQQFAYIVSHNLRAPLANALGFADLLLRTGKDTEVFDNSLKNLHASLRELDAVLSDVSTVLAVRDRQEVPQREPVHLAGVCQRVAQSLIDSLREADATISCQLPDDLQVCGNRAYFHSIFYNLFSNTIKFRAEDRPLSVVVTGTQTPGQGSTITVSDNGSGFDTARAGTDVFQLYKRFHPVKRGRGIGLFLVKSHVEAMGGTVTVESQVNVGTRFILHFS